MASEHKLTATEIDCQNAVDNAYNTYSHGGQITATEAEYMIETKKHVSSTYFWTYVMEIGGMAFREAVTKALS